MSYFNNHGTIRSLKKQKQKQKYSYTDNLRALISMFIKCVIVYEIIKEILTFICFSLFPEVKTIVTFILIFL